MSRVVILKEVEGAWRLSFEESDFFASFFGVYLKISPLWFDPTVWDSACKLMQCEDKDERHAKVDKEEGNNSGSVFFNYLRRIKGGQERN